MVDKSLVDIKTGKPIKSPLSPGEQRKALIIAGKQWHKLREKIADGEIQITITAAGQELDIDDMVIPWLDSLIEDDDRVKKHLEYMRAKSKKK